VRAAASEIVMGLFRISFSGIAIKISSGASGGTSIHTVTKKMTLRTSYPFIATFEFAEPQK